MGASPHILTLLIFIVGCCLGSFLNVVITRLPVMLMRQWRNEARSALELPEDTFPRFNLLQPRSMCPACETTIAWHDNLPTVGWFKRRGKCAHCKARISPQYPLIELLGGLLGVALVTLYGLSLTALFFYAACLMLLAMAVIDLRTFLLPDALTLPLLWLGLVYQLICQPGMLPSAVVGAMAGYLILWSFYWFFKLLTGKEGMGYGDFKLLAALGAWVGWPLLPLLLVISAGCGAIYGLTAQALVPRLRGQPMPFGPFLAIAGWVCLLVGQELLALYGAWLYAV